MDFLLGQAVEIIHDVLVADVRGLDRSQPLPSIREHSASEAAIAEVHPNVRYLASTTTS